MRSKPGVHLRWLAAWAVSSCLAAAAGTASGQVCGCEFDEACDPAVMPYDEFGWSVAIRGPFVVVGAPAADNWCVPACDTGLAHVFYDDAGLWHVGTLVAPDAAEDDRFGDAVAVEGVTIVVGAPRDDDAGTSSGSAYVFQGVAGWPFVAKLTASDADSGDWFGVSVAISGDTVVIGGWGEAAYVFERDHGGPDNWGEVTKLTPPEPSGDFFGSAVAISGDVVVVGAPYEAGGGAAYVFERDAGGPDQWDQIAKIALEQPDGFDWLGRSVSIDGSTVILGGDQAGSSAFMGAAHIFERDQGGPDQWGLVASLIESYDGGGFGGDLGRSVSISGDIAVAGARAGVDGTCGEPGKVYAYRRDQGGPNNWGLVARLRAPDMTESDHLGWSVAVAGARVVMGGPGIDCCWECPGWAYAVDLDACAETFIDCNGNGASDECDIEDGTSLDCNDNGFPDECDLDDGTSLDCNENAIPDECETDCNDNGVPDDCDIDDGTSLDCNGNAIPDECEPDCNDNGVPDDCDVNHGTSEDLNNNLEPDECESFNVGCALELHASDAMPNDYFGGNVAIDGDTVLIRASFDTFGAVYVFERNHGGAGNWGEVIKVIASDGEAHDHFGSGLAIDGDRAVIGAEQGSDPGAAYIFERDHGGPDNWGEVVKLVAPDGASNDRFGWRVAVDRDTVVIGAWGDDDYGYNSGSAYIFERVGPTWTFVTKLTASDADESDYFGGSVALCGDTVVIGAHFADGAAARSGAAYIFERDHGGPGNWGEFLKLEAPDGWGGDSFGDAVSIIGDVIAVGAPLSNDLCWDCDSGSVYIFERDEGGPGNWGDTAKLLASDPAEYDRFGWDVSIGFAGVAVGTTRESHSRVGAAYFYQRDQGSPGNWNELARLTPVGTVPDDGFGRAVSISGDIVLVGASNDADAGDDAGAAFVFDLQTCVLCPADVAPPPGVVGSTDFLALLAAWGTDPGGPPDLDGDGNVGATDFLALLAAWGPCLP